MKSTKRSMVISSRADNSPPVVQDTKPFRFFDLPLEIRNLVYTHYLDNVSIVANTDKFDFVAERPLRHPLGYYQYRYNRVSELTTKPTYIVRSLLYSGRRTMIELRDLMLAQTTFEFENCEDLTNIYVDPKSIPLWLSVKSFHPTVAADNILKEIRKARIYLTSCESHRSGSIQRRSVKASMNLLTASHMPSLQALEIRFCYSLYVLKFESIILRGWFLGSLTSLSTSVAITMQQSSHNASPLYEYCTKNLQQTFAKHRRADLAVTYGESICAGTAIFDSYGLQLCVHEAMLDQAIDSGEDEYATMLDEQLEKLQGDATESSDV